MSDTESRPPIDAETLERLRRGIPLRMDARGQFTLGGDLVTHPRVLDAFRRGLDITEAGEHQLHIGDQWCYLTVEDCPLRATAVRVGSGDNAPLTIRLDDGRSVPLELAGLWEEPERGLRCSAPARRSGRALAVRFSNTAQMDLARWIVWDDGAARPQLDLHELGVAARLIPDAPPS
ncbi:MAG: hypothetical protein H6713_16910 [Myxococcales bacterium]|nr:hypothetical protein [Myxococcales bacterium]